MAKHMCFKILFLNALLLCLNKCIAEVLPNNVPCLNDSILFKQRPGSRVPVYCDISIISLSSFSDARMEFTAEFYFTQHWLDKRCKYEQPEGTETILTTMFMK